MKILLLRWPQKNEEEKTTSVLAALIPIIVALLIRLMSLVSKVTRLFVSTQGKRQTFQQSFTHFLFVSKFHSIEHYTIQTLVFSNLKYIPLNCIIF